MPFGADTADTCSSSSLPFVGPATGAQSLGVSDLAAIDPSTYIEPMELYDSIFWGEFTNLYLVSLLLRLFVSTSLCALLSRLTFAALSLQNPQILGTLGSIP